MPDPGYTVEIDEESGTVTIHGAGFGAKPGGGPPFFWLDLGQTAGPAAADPISRWQAWAGLNPDQSTTEFSVAQVAAGSLRALRADFAADGNGVFEPIVLPVGTAHWYIWVKKYYDFSHPDPLSSGTIKGWNWKTMRAWENVATGNNDIYGMGWATPTVQGGASNNALGNFASGHIPQVPGTGWHGNNQGFYLQISPTGTPNADLYFQTWYVPEWELHHSSAPGLADGYSQMVASGVNGLPQVNTTQFISHTAEEGMVRVIFQEQRSNGTYTTPAWTYYDSYFVEDSGCRVIVSDESSWQEATRLEGGDNHLREIQIPLTWADTLVTCRYRQGSHPTLDGRWLYVRSDDRTTRRIGRFTVS